MTQEEFDERKQILIDTVSMYEVLARYGVNVRGNRCKGFCHGGKDWNMKVFKDGCNCFVCGINFDVFDVTMHFEGCDFGTAFRILGGDIEPSKEATQKARQSILERQTMIDEQTTIQSKLKHMSGLIRGYKSVICQSEPYSETWCYCQNELPKLRGEWEELFAKLKRI